MPGLWNFSCTEYNINRHFIATEIQIFAMWFKFSKPCGGCPLGLIKAAGLGMLQVKEIRFGSKRVVAERSCGYYNTAGERERLNWG